MVSSINYRYPTLERLDSHPEYGDKNNSVREAASSLPGAVLSDHHDFMQGAQYIDPFHFSPPDRAYQAGKTAGLLLPLLSARQEPPKEQECPKSRPEP